MDRDPHGGQRGALGHERGGELARLVHEHVGLPLGDGAHDARQRGARVHAGEQLADDDPVRLVAGAASRRARQTASLTPSGAWGSAHGSWPASSTRPVADSGIAIRTSWPSSRKASAKGSSGRRWPSPRIVVMRMRMGPKTPRRCDLFRRIGQERAPDRGYPARHDARRVHFPRQGRPGRDAQGRRDHGRGRRRAGEDRRGRRRGRRHGARARARRHPPRRRRGPHVRPGC